MDDSSAIGLSAGSGIVGIIVYVLFKYCYKKELHTKCKNAMFSMKHFETTRAAMGACASALDSQNKVLPTFSYLDKI